MFFSPQRLPFSWSSTCIALVGVVYCAIQVAPVPVPVPCPGTGCQLFQNFAFYGVSLWWIGVTYFAFMALACLRRANLAALFIAAAALIADTILLAIMLMTAACITCLGAGLLIALLYLSLRSHCRYNTSSSKGLPIALLIWSGLFIAAAASAATEGLAPWRIAGTETAERRVYFAPSCPACRDAVKTFSDSAAFIPLAEEDSDNPAIYTMHKGIQNGLSPAEALETAMQAKRNGTLAEPSFPDSLIFRLRLIRNKADVLRLGFRQLPLIMINGMPQNSHDNSTPQSSSQPVAHPPSSALPPELFAPLNSCGDASPEPCDPPL